MRFQQPIDRSLRDKILLLVGEPNGQLSRRQLWELQRQVDDLAADIVRDAIPDAVRSSAMVGQRFRPAVTIAIIPSVKGGAGNTELVQRALGRQV
jgi:hypothetical protein